MRKSILLGAGLLLLATAFVGCAVEVSTAQEPGPTPTPAPAQQVGAPSIDWEDTVPTVYTPTGCKVIWNDTRRVYEYLFAGTGWVMARPEVAFKDAEEDAVLSLGHTNAIDNHYPSIAPLVSDFTRAEYDRKYKDTVATFAGHHLLLTDGINAPLPLSTWQAALDWDADVDGYGRDWYWLHGLAVAEGLHPRVVRHKGCYHIAAGSQDSATSTWRILPAPAAE